MYLARLLRYWASKISRSRTWPFGGNVTSSVTLLLDSQYGVSYRWSIWTKRLSRTHTVFEILSFKGIGVSTLTFRVTWRHRSCDHWIPKVWFPIGSQYGPTMYLTRLLRRRYHDAFDYDGSDRNYDMRSIRLRYDYDPTIARACFHSTRAKIEHVNSSS